MSCENAEPEVEATTSRSFRENLAGGSRRTRDWLMPYCLFTDPPLAHVGLIEEEARRRGASVRVAKLPMSEVLRMQAIVEPVSHLTMAQGPAFLLANVPPRG